MAKSKNGGSRAYIRGRIGSDVYSIGKNGKGDRQQVVRSLAETVANPRTAAQMAGRMYMSTVMQAVSAMTALIDHSFDGFPKGQPSISEFIRTNYALIKADAIANAASNNQFGLNKYQEKGLKIGYYQMSAGTLVKSSKVTFVSDSMQLMWATGDQTVGGLKAAIPELADGYITFVCIDSTQGFKFFRISLATGVADNTAISAENVNTIFKLEGNVVPTLSVETTYIQAEITNTGDKQTYGVIVSRNIDGAWKHSKCVLSGDKGGDFNSDTALPTYPTGAEQFLNGGDL